jgi:SEL1 protein
MYELVANTEGAIESGKEEKIVNFGDLREKLGGEYVANVLPRSDGGAVAGIGMHRYVFLPSYLTCDG